MYRVLSLVCFGTAAALWTSSFDLDEVLTAQGKADKDASERAECWCKEVKELVSSRLSAAEVDKNNLEHLRTSQGFENDRLRQEVAQRSEEVASHSQSLDTMGSIADKSTSAHADEHAELKASLRSVHKAIDALGEHAGGEVANVLHRLKENFSKKLNASKSRSEGDQSHYEGLRDGKEEMLRLAKRATTETKSRLAAGNVVVAQSSSQIAALEGQAAADGPLMAAVRSLCDNLEAQATERQSKRQSALVATSQAKAEEAQARSMKAALKVMMLSRYNKTAGLKTSSVRAGKIDEGAKGDCAGVLERAEDTKRRAAESLDGAKDSAGKLMALIDQSNEIEAGLGKMLQNMFMETHLAESRGALVEKVKNAVSALGESAQADLKSLAQPFADLRSLGKTSSLADHKLVVELQSALADASMAVVDAKRCTSF